MVKIEIKSEYLNIESTKDGDIVEIVEEGELVDEEGKFGKDKGKQIKRLYLPVKVNNETLMWTPWNSELKACCIAWQSDDTKTWVGKKLQAVHHNNKLIIKPIVEKKVD